ncbi:MAG: 6-phosphogluconolactonase [Acidimicrobiales bacterium]
MRGPAAEALCVAEPVADVPAAFVVTLEERFAGRAGERFVLLLSGGPTAAAAYDAAAGSEAVDWSMVDIYMGDERVVPPEDPDANQRLVREHLIEKVANVGSFNPMPTEIAPERCAARYDATLRALLEGPGIDLIHLGLGPDGHTASLFPLAPSLEVTDRLCLATEDPRQRNPHARLSVTYPVIDAARSAVFTVAGNAKHEAINRLRDGENLPAARVAAAEIIWLLDSAASKGRPS